MGLMNGDPKPGSAHWTVPLGCSLITMEQKDLLGAVSLLGHWGVGVCYHKALSVAWLESAPALRLRTLMGALCCVDCVVDWKLN